jgi:uncharacterized protein
VAQCKSLHKLKSDASSFVTVIEERDSMTQTEQIVFQCSKCDGREYVTGELRTTGSGLSRFFNIQNQKYATVSCKECGFTELYKLEGRGIGNVIDFFTN